MNKEDFEYVSYLRDGVVQRHRKKSKRKIKKELKKEYLMFVESDNWSEKDLKEIKAIYERRQ